MSKPVPSLLLCVLLLACATPQRDAERQSGPLFESLTLFPFSVEPHHAEGEAVRTVPAALLQTIADEATASANSALVRSGITSKVESAPAGAATVPGYGIRGTIRFPAFLPKDEEIHRELGRLEPFVKATLTLVRPDGKATRSVDTLLTWEDLHGPDGAPIPSDRPFEDVVRGAVRQAVEDAVDHLAHESGNEPENS